MESIQSDFSSDPQAHIMMATQLPTRTLIPKEGLAGHSYACVDTAADMCSIGGDAWVLDTISNRSTDLAGYDTSSTVKTNIPIGNGITAVDLPNGETILLKVNEATILGPAGHSLLSVVQIREHGIYIDEKPRLHGGQACMIIDDYVIPFSMQGGLLVLKIRKPTQQELSNCDTVEVTRDLAWLPEVINEPDMSPSEYGELVHATQQKHLQMSRTTRVPRDPDTYAPYFFYPDRRVMQKTTPKYNPVWFYQYEAAYAPSL